MRGGPRFDSWVAHMEGYVYLLRSESSGILYLGATEDPSNREKEHNKGTTEATRGKGPWKMVQHWVCRDIAQAKRIEYKIKKKKRKLSVEFVDYCVKNMRDEM